MTKEEYEQYRDDGANCIVCKRTMFKEPGTKTSHYYP